LISFFIHDVWILVDFGLINPSPGSSN